MLSSLLVQVHPRRWLRSIFSRAELFRALPLATRPAFGSVPERVVVALPAPVPVAALAATLSVTLAVSVSVSVSASVSVSVSIARVVVALALAVVLTRAEVRLWVSWRRGRL